MAAIITDLASFKADPAGIGHTTADNDAALTILINSVDWAFQTWMKRPAEQKLRVETIPVVHDLDRMVVLEAAPIVSIDSVVIDATRSFSGGPTSSADYTFDPSAGTLHFDFDLSAGINTIQVTYTGGMATTVANFILAYPDIHHWANMQVEYEWERRHNAGATSTTQAGGTRTFVSGVKLLDGSREAMAPYRRTSVG